MVAPTKRQLFVLRAFIGFEDAYGFPPTTREVAWRMGRSNNAACCVLNALIRHGLIERRQRNASRAWYSTDLGRRLAGAGYERIRPLGSTWTLIGPSRCARCDGVTFGAEHSTAMCRRILDSEAA
jgi:hypothetical protein